MADILYKTFLLDEAEYERTHAHWRELFEQILAGHGYTWRPYLNTTTVDGTPLRDGNPVFHAYIPEIDRAVRVIQEAPEEPAEFDSWIHETEGPGEQPLAELVISLVLTEETRRQAEEAIRTWVGEW